MTDEEAAEFLKDASGDDLPFAQIFPLNPCPHCHFDLDTLPISARFCPQCGLDLTPKPAAPLPRPLPVEVAPFFAPGANRSALVRGFARALYGLGVRYDATLGARANRHEAIRYYQKAAKLGDDQAVVRLIGHAASPLLLPAATSNS